MKSPETFENCFFEELDATPPLPDDIYESVSQHIAHEKRGRVFRWALAALLALAIFTTYQIRIGNTTEDQLAAQEVRVSEQLEEIRDYFAVDNFEEEIATYAILDPSIFTYSQEVSYETD